MTSPPIARRRFFGATLLVLCVFAAHLRVSADSVVVFNEIHYNPTGTAEDGEWVELYNQMGINVDLSGWRLDNGIEYTFPTGTVVPPGEYLVVAKNPAHPSLNGLDRVVGPYEGFLSNGGERVDLRSGSDRLMDRIDYNDSGEWPVASDGGGVSLVKREPGLPSGKSKHWMASPTLGGSPGRRNFPLPGDLTRHTPIPADAAWKYHDGANEPAEDWTASVFDDGEWKEGQASFGTASGDAPTDLTVTDHLVQRFRASDLPGVSDGQVLSTWPDTADGDGVNQNASSGGNPTYIANATPSGEPAVHFDGNDEFRTARSPGIGGGSGFVYFAVVGATSAPNSGTVRDGSGPYLWDRVHSVSGNPLVSLKTQGGRFGFQKRHDNGSGLGGPVSNTAVSISQFQIVALRRNRTTSQFELWIDGEMEASVADSGSPLTPQPIVVGRHATNVNGGFTGHIAELLIYNDQLSDAEFESVGAYLETQYGLDTAFSGSTFRTPLDPSGTTFYFRQEFSFSGNPSRTQLRLQSTTADGAVFYLNGTEIHRRNLPDGDLSHGTSALTDVEEPESTGFVPISASSLHSGVNVLAVSLHTASGNQTASFSATLEGTESPPNPASSDHLVLNEISGAQDDSFYLELVNPTQAALSTSGYVLALEGSLPRVVSIPHRSLQPGETLLISEQMIGERPLDNDKVFLKRSSSIVDARRVTNRLRGRSSDHAGRWLFPQGPSPGGENLFQFESDIVINEICYNPLLPEDDEQWVELFNRGVSPVDLTGWNFGEGIGYTFSEQTSLNPGEYLVVANNPTGLLAKHPGIRVVGPFSGNLSRSGETLLLRDAQNNPADQVRYHDGGRWPRKADGQGATLELRDARADNSLPGAWGASDEVARTEWRQYSYRGRTEPSAVGPDGQWQEFIFGLLEEGEVLLDDIQVYENPSSSRTPLLLEGTFEGRSLRSWRLLGNHRHARIVPDPDDPNGKVLYLRATGSTEHMHNHVETTTRRSISNSREYEITFRARWLSGSNQLHTRLYFNRLPRTTELLRPDVLGTPGAANSIAESNAGPTTWGLRHDPPAPAPGEPVTISLEATDPDGISALVLHYSVNDGAFRQVPMSLESDSRYVASIPGQFAGRIVQFYVAATDGEGERSFTPAAAADSGALFQIDDGRAAQTGIHNFRIIVTPEHRTWMHTPRNVMSNDRLPCTVIYKESEIYYNVGVRIKGSERARSQVPRVGFNLAFNKDQLFRGVHRTIAIDRSEGVNMGQRELLFDIMATNSHGIPGEFNDLCYVISPDPSHTSPAVLQLARYGSVFLDEQFDRGSEGTVFEYELVYYPRTTDGQGYKLPQPDNVTGKNITSLGSDKEDYRWTYLIKNNQEHDDYSGMLAMTNLFDQSSTLLNRRAGEVLDVDQWLRAMAYSCAAGAGDSYFSNSRHNGQFYARPDGKVLYFPHDIDFAFSTSRNIFENTELQKLTADRAHKQIYLGHLHDICTTVYNTQYMADWTRHFDALIPGGNVFSDDLSYIGSRSSYILSQVNGQLRPRAFNISTNGGRDFTTTGSPVTLTGTGWVNVREIRLADSGSPLPIRWTNLGAWAITVPVSPGLNVIELEAINFSGEVIGSDTIRVTSTSPTELPSAETLVVSEIYYNPPGDEEGAEFIELLNVGGATLDLTGLSFTNGVSFTFSQGSSLDPGERVVVVRDEDVFRAVFGNGVAIAGSFEGGLENRGERLTLNLAAGEVVHDFAYNDKAPWPTAADGDGFSLVLRNPTVAPDHSLAANWIASAISGGTPGTSSGERYVVWKEEHGSPADDANDDGDDLTVVQEFFFGGEPDRKDDLGPNFVVQPDGQRILASITRRAGLEGEVSLQVSTGLEGWIASENAILLSNERLPGSLPPVDVLTYELTLDGTEQFFRFVLGE